MCTIVYPFLFKQSWYECCWVLIDFIDLVKLGLSRYKSMDRFKAICDSNILCSFTCHLNPFYNPIRSYTQACTICVVRVNKVRTGPPNLWGVSNLLVAQNSVFYKRKNHSLGLQILVIYSKFQIPSWTPAYLEYFGPLVLLSIFFWWKSYFHRILLTVYFYCRH